VLDQIPSSSVTAPSNDEQGYRRLLSFGHVTLVIAGACRAISWLALSCRRDTSV